MPDIAVASQDEDRPKETKTWANRYPFSTEAHFGYYGDFGLLDELKVPFPEDRIKWRTQSGFELAYIEVRDVFDRLDEVVGPFNWKSELKNWGENGVVARISIFISGQWVHKEDGADRSQIEGDKGGISDALKRAAVQWGIGRYLYRLPKSKTRQLPDFALPPTPEPAPEEAEDRAKEAISAAKDSKALLAIVKRVCEVWPDETDTTRKELEGLILERKEAIKKDEKRKARNG